MIKRILSLTTHKIYTLPVLVLMPHSRCNCRCVMCDIWKANSEKRELSADEIQKQIRPFQQLGVKRVALSGGEALMHSNLWALCRALKSIGIKISLLSTGVTLKHHAVDVVANCDDVIVSLDGSPTTHNQIRGIPNAFEKLAEGVKALKELNSSFKVTGRCVIQKANYKDFENIINAASQLGLNQISFLPADVSSTAFNRANAWENERMQQVSLEPDEAKELENIIKSSFIKFKKLYSSGFIAERMEKMLQIPQHYIATTAQESFPEKKCNAPWVSAVIESNGDVLPCFFHQAYGNIYKDGDFETIINSQKAIQFRKRLDMANNATCQKCVCALHIGPLQTV